MSDPAAAPTQVFISYSSKDVATAERVESALLAAGYKVWRDKRNISDTDVWAEAIQRGLKESDRLVVLLSKPSMGSKEVFPEWFYFYHHRKPLHCLLIESCEIDYHLLPYNYVDARDQFDAAMDRLVHGLRQPFTPPFQAGQEVLVVSPFAAADTTFEETLKSALETLTRPDGGAVALTPEMATQLEEHPPRSMPEYRLGRVAAWCRPRYALDERFVQLSLLIDQGEEAQQRFTETRRFDNLRDVLRDVPDSAVVLLGAPGSGKSTLLRRLELETALDGLRNEAEKVTFFASLAEYQPEREGDPLPSPIDWLSARWKRRFPALPALLDLLHNRRVLLLLDALNEIPHNGTAQFRERVDLWKAFLQTYIRDLPGNRAIFTCRSLDYSAPLSSKELRVPQIRIEPMDDDRVQTFLKAYLFSPAEANTIWKRLSADKVQLDLFRVPFFLKMLTDQATDGGHIPEGRAQLFSGFIRRLLRREADQPLLKPDSLLTGFDHERLFDDDAARRNPTMLPDDGLLIPTLTMLAFRMQDAREKTEQNQVRIGRKQAFELMPAPSDRRADIFRVGCSLTVLDHDRAFDQVLFFHQLLQEFFAARQLAETPDPAKWHVEWREGLAAPVPTLSDYEPLPPLPGTGWEETTVIAAGLSRDPDAFISKVMAENLPLAARCAAQPEVRVSEPLKNTIREMLIQRTADPNADLRARIAAGLALGTLGDPRFERRKGPHGAYLLPPLVTIPAGEYPIGADNISYEAERPRHTVPLATFQIGKFPVTNAEYALFMAAGGYDDDQWWETDAAKAWRKGEGVTEGPKRSWRDTRKVLLGWKATYIDDLVKQNRVTSEQAEDWKTIREWTEEQFEAWLDESFPKIERYIQPSEWTNEAFNNPNQPVVGICWYEARAYCAWLSAQISRHIRLPTEAEWEAAASGLSGRQFAYGETFDVQSGNTFESHIRRTTPIGVFPTNTTPEGAVDLSGNVYNWTSSVYKSYPYDSADGREDPTSDEKRLLRGGSWFSSSGSARAAFRNGYVPNDRHSSIGFRVCVVGVSPFSNGETQ